MKIFTAILAVVAVVAVVVAVVVVAADDDEVLPEPIAELTPPDVPEGGVSDDFSLVIMVHSGESPGGFDVPGTTPWDGEPREGEEFAYRSIPCDGDAPINNVASDLPSYGTRIEGSRVPASMRAHPMVFSLEENGDDWEMQGSITFTVCQLGPGPRPEDDDVEDDDRPKIEVSFSGGFDRVGPESINFSGDFEITGGTGRYAELEGEGDIAGYLFCFDPDGCETFGEYRDGQLVMQGVYGDPSPDLEAGPDEGTDPVLRDE
jgi:hypothetical protein